MVLEKISFRRICNKPITILYVLIIIALTFASIWDVVGLINSYKYDNVATEVHLRSAFHDYSWPFLQNPAINLRYYGNSDIYREAWNATDAERNRLRNYTNLWQNPTIFNLTESGYMLNDTTPSDKPLSLKNRFDLGQITNFLHIIDETFLFDGHLGINDVNNFNDTVNFYANYHPGLYNLVDRYVSNFSNNVELIERVLYDILTYSYQVERNENIKPSPTFLVDQFNSQQIKFIVPLKEHMEQNRSTITYSFGGKDLFAKHTETNGGVMITINFSPFAYNSYAAIANSADDTLRIILAQNHGARARIRISNNGMYSSAMTNQACSSVFTELDCLINCTIFALAQACQCRPFSYRRLFKNSFYVTKFPFCTSELYRKCRLNHNISIDTITFIPTFPEANNCRDSFIPCVIIRNQYTVTQLYRYKTVSIGQEGIDHWPLKVTFECIDPSYVIFQEKPQTTWTQLVSQIGGDLGLYLGFSLFGVWKVILFCWTYYYHRRRQTKVNINDNATTSMALTWLRWATQTPTLNQNQDLEGVLKSLITKIDNLKSDHAHLLDRFGSIDDRVQILETPQLSQNYQNIFIKD